MAAPKTSLYRCQNRQCSKDPHGRLIFDFELPATSPPVCPSCGTDMRQKPQVVIRRKLMHFDAPDPLIEGKGINKAACGVPVAWEASDRVGYTGDAGAVTCAACKRTAIWREVAVETRVIEAYDLEPLEEPPQ